VGSYSATALVPKGHQDRLGAKAQARGRKYKLRYVYRAFGCRPTVAWKRPLLL